MSVLKASIIVVNYNSGLYLRRCVESVLASDIPVQLIIVDNASSDDSLQSISAIVERSGALSGKASEITIIRNERNHGFSKGVNIGFEIAMADYVLLLNPDCVVFPRTVRSLSDELISDSNIGVVGALVFNEDGSEQRGCRRNEPTLRRSIVTSFKLGKWYEGIDQTYQSMPSSPVEVDAVSGAAMMVNRRHFESVGQMDEDYFLHCEDLDICRKMRDAGHTVVFCPTVSVFHYQGVSEVSSFFVERHKHRGMVTYYQKHHDKGQRSVLYRGTILMVTAHFLFTSLIRLIKGSAVVRRITGKSTKKADSPCSVSTPPLVRQDKPLVLISGANSDVGDFLLERLDNDNCQYIALTRDQRRCYQVTNKHGIHVHWLPLSYFQKVPQADFGEVHRWISLAPIWVTSGLIKVLDRFKPKQIIAFSSTSIEGKKSSESSSDQVIVNRLVQGEQTLSAFAESEEVPVDLLRPTLIYGGPRNQNINFIRRFIRCFRFFPILGEGKGERQPVHADDLAKACLLICARDHRTGKRLETYDMGGGEILSYKEMVVRVFQSEDIKPRFWKMSPSLVSFGISVLRLLPGLRFLSKGMAQRISSNLTYSVDKAKDDFAYQPRRFEP
ncbi:MAG: glycosyltransferase [Gammaproteobacteria bacterium]|nr:glycosyltransferase [Gammaproteobacteria bacterium]